MWAVVSVFTEVSHFTDISCLLANLKPKVVRPDKRLVYTVCVY